VQVEGGGERREVGLIGGWAEACVEKHMFIEKSWCEHPGPPTLAGAVLNVLTA